MASRRDINEDLPTEDSESVTRNIAQSDLWDEKGSALGASADQSNLFASQMHFSSAPSKKEQVESLNTTTNGNDSDSSKWFWIRLSILVALLAIIGVLGTLVFLGRGDKAELASRANKLVNLSSVLSVCDESKKQAVGELSGCVSDVDTLTSQLSVAAAGAAPETSKKTNNKLQKTLQKKVVLEKELEELEIRIFDQIKKIRSYRDIKRKAWRRIRRDVKARHKLDLKLSQAVAAYEVALTAAANHPNAELKEPDSNLLERNRLRAAYIEEIKSTPDN